MRVVVAEDEALLRGGLRSLLESAGIDVVADVGDASSLLRVVQADPPDIVVTDIRMPPGWADDGLRAAIVIRSQHPSVAVMVLSQHVQRRFATELLATGRGGIGYLLKHRVADVTNFLDDLRTVARGGTILDREVVDIMVKRAARSTETVDNLTARQREVLALVAEGRSNVAIAGEIHISERGVVQHISNIYLQLGLRERDDQHRRVLAVLRYLEDAGS